MTRQRGLGSRHAQHILVISYRASQRRCVPAKRDPRPDSNLSNGINSERGASRYGKASAPPSRKSATTLARGRAAASAEGSETSRKVELFIGHRVVVHHRPVGLWKCPNSRRPPSPPSSARSSPSLARTLALGPNPTLYYCNAQSYGRRRSRAPGPPDIRLNL